MLPIFIAIGFILALAILVRVTQSPEGIGLIGEFGTQLARPVVIPIVNLINQPSFVYIASLVIVLAALGVVWFYSARVMGPQMRASRKAIHEIAALSSPARAEWRVSLAALQGVLQRNGVMMSPFTTYEQQANEEDRVPARRFSLFVEADSANPLQQREGTMAALPGYFTTLGLILTFVGLVVALYFAARGFRSGDMNEARQAIVQLLNASAFKFLTSVAALVSALMISLAHRFQQSRLRTVSWQLVLAIDAYLLQARNRNPDTAERRPELILADKLNALISELAQTRAAMTELNASMNRERA
jgi:hypothetical protein